MQYSRLTRDCKRKVMLITSELISTIKRQFRIHWGGIHGISHWARVFDNGMKLSDQTGANQKVVQLFSVFHDSRKLPGGQSVEYRLLSIPFYLIGQIRRLIREQEF